MSEKLYLPKEVVNILGISGDLLRKWCEEFNIITDYQSFKYLNTQLFITYYQVITAMNLNQMRATLRS